MINQLRKILPENSFIRLTYSWLKAICARIIYGNPSKELYVIGVTGTDGKTTTSHFIADLLENLGEKVAMSATDEIWIAGNHKKNISKRTTLSPLIVQRFLREAIKKKCKVAVLEVSSHALYQGRIFGIDFNAAIVTNISQEHCNYHNNIEEYAKVKSKLCSLVLNSPKEKKIIVLNKKMKFFDIFSKIYFDITYTYDLENDEADITAKNIKGDLVKTFFTIETLNESFETQLNVPGIFNVENVLAAAIICNHFGFEYSKISKKISKLKPVLGRLEKIDVKANYKVFIDFALTPLALEKLLEYFQNITKGNVILVFGCTGGNHDKVKRPIMGEIASRLADYIVITEDETYGEDNEQIMRDIESGFHKNFISFKKISDRKKAIHFALKNAKCGDIVLITGMGSFESRYNGKKEIKWSDRKVVEKFLQKYN